MKRIVTVLLAAIMLFSGLQIAMAEEITEAVASEESLAQETVAEIPAEAPAAEESAAAEPAAEEPEAPAAEEPAEKQAAEEPASEEPEANKQAEEAAAEKPAEKEPATTAAAEEPTVGEPEEVKASEETAPAFTGTLSTTGCKVAETGSEAYVEAIVSGANMGYSVYWEQEFPELLELQGPEAVWKRIENADGEQYRFTVAQTSGSYSLRAVLCAEDGTILTSNITVEVQEPASAEQPEEKAEAEEPTGEDVKSEEPTEDELTEEEPAVPAQIEEPATNEPVVEESDEVEIEDYETPLGIPAEAENTGKNQSVTIFSSHRKSMKVGEYVHLTSRIEGFDGYEIRYQWECDKHDGMGFQDVSGADSSEYSFRASAETLSWDWRLSVYYD